MLAKSPPHRWIATCGLIALLAFTNSALAASETPYCGRIVIEVEAAGEGGVLEGKLVPSNCKNNLAFVLKGFVQDSPVEVPTLIISSSSYVKSASGVAALAKRKTGVGMLRLSVETFDRLAEAKSEPSYLQAIKEALASSKKGQTLLKEYPGHDISKFIKVEIVISGGHGDGGHMEGWRRNEDSGTVRDLARRGTAIEPKHLKFIGKVLPESTFQVIIGVCSGEGIGADFQKALGESRTSYAAFCRSGQPIDDFTHSEKHFLQLHADRHTINGKWAGSTSLFELILPKFTKLSALLSVENLVEPNFRNPLFGQDPTRVNPFDSFVVTSADIRAEKIVAAARSLNQAVPAGDAVGWDRVKEIDRMIELQKKEHDLFLQQYKTRYPDQFRKSQQAMNQCWVRCFRSKERTSDSGQLSGFIDAVFEDQLKTGAAAEVDLLESGVAFRKFMESTGEPETQNALDNAPLSFLPAMHKSFLDFSDCRDKLYWVAQTWREAGRIPETQVQAINGALRKVNDAALDYFWSYLAGYFPDLIKDTFDRRRETLHKAAEYLVAHYAERRDPLDLQELEGLRDDLAHVTTLPIGPMFDREYLLQDPAQPRKSTARKK